MVVRELFENYGDEIKAHKYRGNLPKASLKDFDSLSHKEQDAIVDIHHWLDLNADDLHDKAKVVTAVLQLYKHIVGNPGSRGARNGIKDTMSKLLGALRTLGIDYPEFKVIEKSTKDT